MTLRKLNCLHTEITINTAISAHVIQATITAETRVNFVPYAVFELFRSFTAETRITQSKLAKLSNGSLSKPYFYRDLSECPIRYEIQILKNQKPSNTVPRMTVLLFASIRAKLPIVDFEPRFYCRTNYRTPRLTPLTGTNAAARYKRISSDARNKRRNAFRRQKTRHRTIKNPPDKGRIISVS